MIDYPGIAAVIAAVGGIVAMVLGFIISMRQIPQVHKLVNSAATAQEAKIDRLEKLLDIPNGGGPNPKPAEHDNANQPAS